MRAPQQRRPLPAGLGHGARAHHLVQRPGRAPGSGAGARWRRRQRPRRCRRRAPGPGARAGLAAEPLGAVAAGAGHVARAPPRRASAPTTSAGSTGRAPAGRSGTRACSPTTAAWRRPPPPARWACWRWLAACWRRPARPPACAASPTRAAAAGAAAPVFALVAGLAAHGVVDYVLAFTGHYLVFGFAGRAAVAGLPTARCARMIVGFDATTLAGRISGVGYYTARLMESLANGAGEGIARSAGGALQPRAWRCRPASGWRSTGAAASACARSGCSSLLPRILRELQPDLVHFTNYLAPLALARALRGLHPRHDASRCSPSSTP